MQNKNKEKLSYERLWLQITRKCNLSCIHCYCGQSQNAKMSKETIDTLARKTKYIKRLYFVGGEITEAIDTMLYCLDSFKRHGVAVNNVRFSTNASRQSQELVDCINKWLEYITPCKDDEDCGKCKIFISTDKIHKESIKNLDENIAFYQNKIPSAIYRFIDGADGDIILKGNAIKNKELLNKYTKKISEPRIYFEKINLDDNNHLSNIIEMSVKGNILTPQTNLDYIEQDNQDYIVTNVNDNMIQKIKEYNNSPNVVFFDAINESHDKFLCSIDNFISKDYLQKCYEEYENDCHELISNRNKFNISTQYAENYYNFIKDDQIPTLEHGYIFKIIIGVIDQFENACKYYGVYMSQKEKQSLFRDIITVFKNILTSSDSPEEKDIALKKISDDANIIISNYNYKNHIKTHLKYPQMTPKECVMWDNSTKQLAKKQGVVYNNAEMKQRHKDIINNLKEKYDIA